MSQIEEKSDRKKRKDCVSQSAIKIERGRRKIGLEQKCEGLRTSDKDRQIEREKRSVLQKSLSMMSFYKVVVSFILFQRNLRSQATVRRDHGSLNAKLASIS